jgi:hypothetical protein
MDFGPRTQGNDRTAAWSRRRSATVQQTPGGGVRLVGKQSAEGQ